MLKRLFSALFIVSLATTGCSDNGANSNSDSITTVEEKLKKYESMLEGEWKWVPIPTQMLMLKDGRSLYVIDGKPDRDTGYYSITTENPNPKAGYLIMAQVFCANQMIYFKNDKKLKAEYTVANPKKAYAIIGMNEGFIQMIDTETGTMWEFKK